MTLFIRALKRWWHADPATHGAALAYYAIFSIAPLSIIFVTLLGNIFGKQAVEEKLMGALHGFAGANTSQLIQTLVTYFTNSIDSVVIASISALFVIIGALALFSQAQRALEDLWHINTPYVQPPTFMRTKILAVSMIFILGLLIVLSLGINMLAPFIFQYVSTSSHAYLSALVTMLENINAVISFGYIVAVFALMYKYLPGQTVSWRAALSGGLIGGLLFIIGRFILNMYLASLLISSIYGTTGAVVLILVWFYYIAQIFFFGGALAYAIDQTNDLVQT